MSRVFLDEYQLKKYEHNQLLSDVLDVFNDKYTNNPNRKCTFNPVEIINEIATEAIYTYLKAMKTQSDEDLKIASACNLYFIVFLFALLDKDLTEAGTMTLKILDKLDKCNSYYDIAKKVFKESQFIMEEVQFNLEHLLDKSNNN